MLKVVALMVERVAIFIRERLNSCVDVCRGMITEVESDQRDAVSVSQILLLGSKDGSDTLPVSQILLLGAKDGGKFHMGLWRPLLFSPRIIGGPIQQVQQMQVHNATVRCIYFRFHLLLLLFYSVFKFVFDTGGVGNYLF